MFLQEFVRGMTGLRRKAAIKNILRTTGLTCAALRNGVCKTIDQAEEMLSEDALERHRHDHDTFGPSSPYISVSAGTYLEGNLSNPANTALYAFDTALDFAVIHPGADGWIFYGYTFLLGHPAGSHAEFAEEVRDLHQHPSWSQFRHEGELAVAARVPPRRLHRAEHYSYSDVMHAWGERLRPSPDDIVENRWTYQPPDTVLRAREVI